MAGVVRMPTAMALRPMANMAASAASRHFQQRTFGAVASKGALSVAREQQQQRKSLVEVCRRGYADQAPPAPKKKRAGFLRWTWRLTYLSAIALMGSTAYGIYVNRNPVDQQEPDPNKKTLVVLGKLALVAIIT